MGCLDRAVTPEAVWFGSRNDSGSLQRCKAVGLGFCRRSGSDRFEQAANPDLLLLDVRSEAEFIIGRIPGATWMARGVVEFRLAETVRDADAEIIVYCATGSRAALVQKALVAQGYGNVSAHEGFDTWAGARFPVENSYGTFELIEREKGSDR